MDGEVWVGEQDVSEGVVADQVPAVQRRFAARMGGQLVDADGGAGEVDARLVADRGDGLVGGELAPGLDDHLLEHVAVGHLPVGGLALFEGPGWSGRAAGGTILCQVGDLPRSGCEVGGDVMGRPARAGGGCRRGQLAQGGHNGAPGVVLVRCRGHAMRTHRHRVL